MQYSRQGLTRVEGALDPTVVVTDEVIKGYQSWYGLLRDTLITDHSLHMLLFGNASLRYQRAKCSQELNKEPGVGVLFSPPSSEKRCPSAFRSLSFSHSL